MFSENNQVLSIGSGSMRDRGTYRCEAANKYGRQSRNITVQMYRKHTLVSFSYTMAVVVDTLQTAIYIRL